MLKLSISKETEEFRGNFRSWLETHPPPKVSGADSSTEAFVRVGRAWQATLASGNWVGCHWPAQFGGRGLSLVEEAIVQEELVRVGAPQLLGLFGITMVGPVLIKHGSDLQKQRFLANILSGKEIWCQGFSEPGAGSDLAAVKTRARMGADGFILSGQKVWTSFAQVADYCFVLCRTSDEPKKHQGLTYLLVDMRASGISTKPLKQITGDDEFNEVFFDEVFVPQSNLVGKVGQGWEIAISTLMYERVVLTFARQIQSEVLLRNLVNKHRDDKRAWVQKELAERTAEACALRALAYEHLLSYAGGQAPGPEGSLDKLFWSESYQSICKLALKLNGSLGALSEGAQEAGADVFRYLYSRGRSIAAGSSEIQRNIIAERILGLPRG